MMCPKNQSINNDDIFFLASQRTEDKETKKKRPWCKHCKKFEYSYDTCCDIHRKFHYQKPKSKRHGRANHTTTMEQLNQFNKEQLEIFQKLIINAQPISFTPNSNLLTITNVAHEDIFSTILKTYRMDKKNSQIINSRASNYMTDDVSLIQNLTIYHENYNVKIVDNRLQK